VTNHVEVYRKLFPAYESFTTRIESLLEELLRAEMIKAHFTESRAKSVDSFSEKNRRPGKSFANPIDEMPDLAGIRIVLYYLDDVTKVGKLIKKEFSVIEEVVEHQSDNYLPDQFGYLSLHYVVHINNARKKLPEWKAFKDFHAEIQVRTVLQHSWAAVSHALQYKREGDVPLDLRRRLFRLAGLFELADEEFIQIRNANREIIEIKTNAVKDREPNIRIDAPVIREFIKISPRFLEARDVMISLGYTFENDPDEDYAGEIVEDCELLGISTVDNLEDIISYEYSDYLQEAKKEEWNVSDTFALQLLIIGSSPESFSIEKLKQKGWSDNASRDVMDGLAKL